MEPKDWGLAVKDVVLGIGGAAAGFVGGPAAAEGIAKVDKTLDRLIAGEAPNAKAPRGERFDRADYAARTPPAPAATAPPASQVAVPPPTVHAEISAEDSQPSGKRIGDEAVAANFLRSAGWSSGKVDDILSGPKPPGPNEAQEVSAREAGAPTGAFRTFEVYGVQGGHAVPLMSVLDRKEGRWQVRPGAQVRATDRSTVGMGLAGAPGRWREYYPNLLPEQYGLHAGKAVLYWEPQRGRALAASGGLLTQLFGRNWRSTVYRTEEEHG